MDNPTFRHQGLGASQQAIIESLRRLGPSTLSELAQRVDLALPTVREHMHVLLGRGLVLETGRRGNGPGRPSTVYGLTEAGRDIFPLREHELLQRLFRHLREQGPASTALLESFFAHEAQQAYATSRDRLDGLTGRRRLREVSLIMTERGFMAEVDDSGDRPRLRLCNCPLRHIVEVSHLPCQAEIGFVRELLGEKMARETFMPNGDHTCSYVAGDTAAKR
jgi:predicted ArsR family transcriptional regulator